MPATMLKLHHPRDYQRPPFRIVTTIVGRRCAVKPESAHQWFLAKDRGFRPTDKVREMVQVCREKGWGERAEEILAFIDAPITAQPLHDVLAEERHLDPSEDLAQLAFNANPCRETWALYRPSALRSIDMYRRLVQAGDAEFVR